VGTANAGEGVVHAFLWQDGVLHDLNDLVGSSDEPFEYLANAVAVDDLGRIAAEAIVLTETGSATRIARLVPVGT
jgi:probable HAF family extracellular repeat protein